MDDRLRPLRAQIDAIDLQLVELLNQRARLASQVGHLKSDHAAPVYRPEREAEVIRRTAAANQGPLPGTALEAVFREVMSACRALERPLAVAYLGPPGTFSEQALLKQFGSAVQEEPCGSIDEVFKSAESGRADYALVPVENSSEGAVSRSLDLLLVTSLAIVAEVSVAVRHHLLTRDGTLQGVARVLAHPQALAQCAGWLNEHAPLLERVSAASNAEAARLAAQDTTAAAIAGEAAAARYGLQPAAREIQDDPHNRTRFVVLGRQQTRPSGRDKTSLILSVANRAGAVYHMLAPLAQHGVSMTRFESRPARTGTWEYYFYVDVEGHLLDEKVATALQALQQTCAFYRCLGSYPVSN